MKKSNNPYIIPFVGLKNGEHVFDFLIGDDFFKDKEYSEVQNANIDTKVTLAKEDNLLVFDIKMEGTINVQCDRCGEPFDFPVWGEQRFIASLTNEKFENEDDIISLSAGASEIDISQNLYEYVNLLLPQKRVHESKDDGSSGCNTEAIKVLNKFSEENKNDEKATDPRWDALKKLKQK